MNHGEVATWLVWLPLLTEPQLAILTAGGESEVRRSIALLHRGGWLFRHRPTTGRLRGREPLLAISPAGTEQLKRAPDGSGMALGALPSWQVQPRTVPAALAAEPVTRIANAAVTAMASALRRDGVGAVSFATHRPVSPRAAKLPGDPRPMLKWGHVEVRVGVGEREARCALFVDRSRLPTARRRSLLEAWRTEREGIALVLCSDEYERSRWLAAPGERSITRVACALQGQVCRDYGVDDRIWRVPGKRSPQSLRGLLEQVSGPSDATLAASADAAELPEPATVGTPEQAQDDLRHTNAASGPWEVTAAAMLRLDPAALRAARTLGIQWWLSSIDIARSAGVPVDSAAHHVDALQALGLAVASDGPDGEPRWLLTDEALQMVGAHAGEAITWRAHATELRIPRVRAARRPPAPVEHDVGAPRALGLVADAARGVGWTLSDWRTEHWWQSEISTQQPVPDAAFVLRGAADRRIVGLVEYERLRGGHQADDKVEGWTRWFSVEGWRGLYRGPLGSAPGERPVVVVLYDGQAVRRRSLSKALADAPAGTPIYAIPEDEFRRDGFASPAWLRAGGGDHGSPLADENPSNAGD